MQIDLTTLNYLAIPVAAISVFGLFAGFFASAEWVAPFLGIFYLFERRSFGHFLVNAGYAIVSLSVMGLIIGAWQ